MYPLWVNIGKEERKRTHRSKIELQAQENRITTSLERRLSLIREIE